MHLSHIPVQVTDQGLKELTLLLRLPFEHKDALLDDLEGLVGIPLQHAHEELHDVDQLLVLSGHREDVEGEPGHEVKHALVCVLVLQREVVGVSLEEGLQEALDGLVETGVVELPLEEELVVVSVDQLVQVIRHVLLDV